MSGEEFLALSPGRRHLVLREIAKDRRSPMIAGLERAVRDLAARQPDFHASMAVIAILGQYRRAQAEQLRSLGAPRRMARYRAGRLTVYQGHVWEGEFPEEVPTINGLAEWRARFDPELADGAG